MKFSDWQLNRLRDALRAYHRYERSHDGVYFTWNDVSEAIDEYTGVIVPPERLRQFVEGVNSKTGGRKFPVPKDQSLEGIMKFVTDEDLELLSKDELNEYSPGFQAPLRLLEYLSQELDSKCIVPAEKIQGVYSMRKSDREAFIIRELTLQRPTEDGLIQVVETEDFYESTAASQFGERLPHDRKEQRKSRVKHGGWAILTPEDNLFFFLKNEAYDKNRYYFTLALNLKHWSDEPITSLILLHHDFPFELEDDDSDRLSAADHVRTETSKNTLMFERSLDS